MKEGLLIEQGGQTFLKLCVDGTLEKGPAWTTDEQASVRFLQTLSAQYQSWLPTVMMNWLRSIEPDAVTRALFRGMLPSVSVADYDRLFLAVREQLVANLVDDLMRVDQARREQTEAAASRAPDIGSGGPIAA